MTVQMAIEWIDKFPGPRLIILNTVNNAAVLANALYKSYGRKKVEHLSTALTPNDRDITLTRIKARLKNKEDTDWTLIATSCVEAGVNLCFRNGFRELSSLASLIQTTGRINREGLYTDSEIWTFVLADFPKINYNPVLQDAAIVLNGYLSKNISISPDLCTNAIIEEIRREGVSSKYKKMLKTEQNLGFESIKNTYKVIDDNTRLAVVSSDIAERIKHHTINWKDLQKNSVQIYDNKLQKLKISEILNGIYFWDLGYDDFLGYMSGVLSRFNS
jgi:CRISPR/Cas system-associated endonuclease/helicase Cas3